MPSSNFNTQTDFSTQVKQYTGTTATLSGNTNILGSLQVKSVEIDPSSPSVGHVLIYDGSKFKSATSDAYTDNILTGMLLTYSGSLTYTVSEGTYRISNILYIYTGGTITILSGNSVNPRFDNVYVTGGTINTFVKSGTPSASPIIPGLFNGQLSVGIISVPVSFTGGTGSTIFQITSNTVFDYYAGGTGIQRAGGYNAEAIGQYSFAPSKDAKAYGQDSIAMGLGAKASGQSQTVVGKYNDPNTTDLFIVGYGTSDGSRANAFRVTTGGSSYVTNKLFISNVEIETTGASSNQALIFDGTKFKPKTITGGTTGTSLGDGVKVLFSSDTTSLSFATLSSQTPSTLSIISSSTGVILFSATTGSGGISGTYVSGLTSAGTGDYSVISSITNNNLVYRTLSAGTGMQITESNGTLVFVSTATGGTSSGNFLPLSGGTLTGGLSATTISATSIDRLNYIDFNTGASVTQNFGRTFFNGTEQTLSYYGEGITEIKVGQQLYSRVYNNTGSILTKGTAVKVTGATQGLPTVCPAIATHTGENTVIGLVANNIANNSSGLVINNGLISGLTLNNFVVGDTLYLSPVSAGTYVNSLSGYGFNIRTNRIGRVVATGTTTGQIYVKTDNEDSTLSLTNLERNIVEGNAISTGIYEFTGITTGSTNTTFNIPPVRGWIVYNTYSYAVAPEVTNVYYSGGTNLTTPFLTTDTQTYILLTSAATISYQTTFPTPQQRRENIYLGKLGHGTRTTILNVFNEPDSDISPLSQIRDMFTPIKLINDGVLVSANGSNLNIDTSAGKLYGMGIGFATNQLNPNSLTVNSTAPTTFQYRTQTGGTGGPYTATTTIDVDYYDLNGARTNIGGAGKTSTNQRIFMLQNGTFRIQYGQQEYGDLATAIAAVDTESFTTFQNFRDNAILIGVLSVRSDATNLSDTAQAKFTFASKFGEVVGGTGGISTTTLQQAYDNSVTPEIVTNSAEGALSIQNGTGNADSVTNLLEGQNTAGSVTSFIRADGVISGTSFIGNGGTLSNIVSGITSAGTGTILLLSGTVVNNNLIQKSLSAGTNIGITETNNTITIRNTSNAVGTITSGTSQGGGSNVFSGVSGANLVFRSLSGTAGLQTAESGNLVLVRPATTAANQIYVGNAGATSMIQSTAIQLDITNSTIGINIAAATNSRLLLPASAAAMSQLRFNTSATAYAGATDGDVWYQGTSLKFNKGTSSTTDFIFKDNNNSLSSNTSSSRVVEVNSGGTITASRIFQSFGIFNSITSTTISSTTVETSIIPTGSSIIGSATLLALTGVTPELVTGKKYRFTANGNITTKSSAAGTLTARMKLGSSVITSISGFSLHPSISSPNNFFIQSTFTIRNASSTGIVVGSGFLQTDNNNLLSGATNIVGLNNLGQITVDCTTDKVFDFTFQFETADPSNTITINEATLEYLN